MARNLSGFPEGIAGHAYLNLLRRQTRAFGTNMRRGAITELSAAQHGFVARTEHSVFRARTVLLATGVVDIRPDFISDADHARGLAKGLIRYCPICDGYEVSDRQIAVIGTGERGCREALFLRAYSAKITLVATPDGHSLDEAQISQLCAAGIAIGGICQAITLREDKVDLIIEGASRSFDTIYPALGSRIQTKLAGQLGANLSADGCMMVDMHQRTEVAGLYAAGDVVLGLDQIGHAIGEAGVAATTIRNDLNEAVPLQR